MKLNKITLANEFFDICDHCIGDVFLHSPHGDVYNVKSKLSQYVAMTELLSEHGDELELFCANKADEGKFYQFFMDNPAVIHGEEGEE